MGGCRCTFRQCHVSSSKYPRMHFFRYPLKEPERFKKWRQYAQMEHMVEFSDVRQKNTTVCARHFRPECFMNYKMERLAPNAVPTLMRLSKEQALDFELDIEKGVLTTLEKTKFKHLIPPDNFECPLHLENDTILLEKLNEILNQEKNSAITELPEEFEYIVSNNVGEYEQVIIDKPVKSSTNAVEILETIQVTAPAFKRTRDFITDENESDAKCFNLKKCKILNSSNCAVEKEIKSGPTIVLTSESHQRDVTNVIASGEVEYHIDHQTEVVNDDGQLLLESNVLTNSNSDGDDEDIEFFEIYKDDNELHYDLATYDSDSTIVQLKTDTHSMTDTIKHQLLTAQNEISDLKKQNENIERLQLKVSLLESENSELKEFCKENEELRKKLLSLEMENNHMKKEYNPLKAKVQEYCEEIKKLKRDVTGIALLRTELVSREESTKEQKRNVKNIKSSQSNENDLEEEFELRLKSERSEDLGSQLKIKEEISVLKQRVEFEQKQLSDTKNQLLKIEADLKNARIEKESVIKQKTALEHSLNNIQNNFDKKQNDYRNLKSDYDNLQRKHSALEQKYWKLQALQSQEATVSTSLENNNVKTTPPFTPTLSSLTKAQLFNGIKRYLNASMVSLLRMEMFGSSEREWKTDERQLAVDVLRLGETVYKYFTDEWRFRLPALRDVRNWLSQSPQMCDEEDL